MALAAVVLGASGYSGGEMLRLLAGHPAIDVVAASASARAGAPIPSALPHLAGWSDDVLAEGAAAAATAADVCFSCLPSGALDPGSVAAPVVVDLADDHRDAGASGWTYGLTEFARAALVGARRIANPGCYPTATLLCLLPFARAGVVAPPVIVDAISGVSGAGRRLEDRLLFSGAAGNVCAYGTTSHRHVPEIERGLSSFAGVDARVSFTPHLAPTTRGVVVTARAALARRVTDEDALALLHEAYADEPFVHVVADWPGTKAVVGTNRAHVSARVDARAGFLVCSSAIDNLGKGAAGQALQNANLALGLEEQAGLGAYGVWP